MVGFTMVLQYFFLVMKLPRKFHIGTQVATRGATVNRRASIGRAWQGCSAFAEAFPIKYTSSDIFLLRVIANKS